MARALCALPGCAAPPAADARPCALAAQTRKDIVQVLSHVLRKDPLAATSVATDGELPHMLIKACAPPPLW